MAVYYVSTTGSNGNNGLSPQTAWATIPFALGQAVTDSTIYVASGSYENASYIELPNKTLSLIRVGETDVVLNSAYANNTIRGTNGGMHTLEGFTVSGSKTSANVYLNNLTHLVLNQCTVVNTYDNANASCILSLNGGDVTINGGVYECPKTALYLTDGTVRLNGPTVKFGAGAYGLRIGHNGAGRGEQEVYCDAVVWDGASTGKAVYRGLAGYVGTVEIKNCTGSCGQLWVDDGQCRHLICTDNVMTLTYSGSKHVACGVEVVDDSDTETNPYPYSSVTISRNTLTFTGASATHLVFAAIGANGATIEDNTLLFSGSTATAVYGIVTKCTGPHINRNRLYVVNAGGDAVGLGLFGAPQIEARHNTVVCSATALRVDVHQDYGDSGGAVGYPTDARIYDNILVSLAATPLRVCVAAPEGVTWGNLSDHNLLWSGGDGETVIALIGDEPVTKAEMMFSAYNLRMLGWTAWLSTHSGFDNDSHSRCGDPLLADPANGDFSLGFGSPAIKAASEGTSIGAWQRSGSPRLLGMGLQ